MMLLIDIHTYISLLYIITIYHSLFKKKRVQRNLKYKKK